MDQDQNATSNTQQAPAPAPAASEPVAKEAAKGAAYGTVLGMVLIVIILIMGAFYVWGARMNSEQPMPAPTDGTNTLEGAIEIDASSPQPN